MTREDYINQGAALNKAEGIPVPSAQPQAPSTQPQTPVQAAQGAARKAIQSPKFKTPLGMALGTAMNMTAAAAGSWMREKGAPFLGALSKAPALSWDNIEDEWQKYTRDASAMQQGFLDRYDADFGSRDDDVFLAYNKAAEEAMRKRGQSFADFFAQNQGQLAPGSYDELMGVIGEINDFNVGMYQGLSRMGEQETPYAGFATWMAGQKGTAPGDWAAQMREKSEMARARAEEIKEKLDKAERRQSNGIDYDGLPWREGDIDTLRRQYDAAQRAAERYAAELTAAEQWQQDAEDETWADEMLERQGWGGIYQGLAIGIDSLSARESETEKALKHARLMLRNIPEIQAYGIKGYSQEELEREIGELEDQLAEIRQAKKRAQRRIEMAEGKLAGDDSYNARAAEQAGKLMIEASDREEREEWGRVMRGVEAGLAEIEDHAGNSGLYGGPTDQLSRHTRENIRPTEQWTEAERHTFQRIAGLRGEQAAADYALKINRRYADDDRQWRTLEAAGWGAGEDSSAAGKFARGAVGIGGKVLAAPAAAVRWWNNLTETIYNGGAFVGHEREGLTGKIVNFADQTDAITAARAEQLNKDYGKRALPLLGERGWGDIYQLAGSIAQSVVYGHSIGEAGTLMLFFGQAADSGFTEAIDRGASGEQAILFSVLSGIAEVAGEKLSLDRMLNAEKMAMQDMWKNILVQAGIEGSEEVMTDVFNLFNDKLAAELTGNRTEIEQKIAELMGDGMGYEDAVREVWTQQAKEIAWDFAGGVLSGSMSSTLTGALQEATPYKESRKGETIFGADAAQLAGEARAAAERSGDVKLQRRAEKAEKRLSSGKSISVAQTGRMVRGTNRAAMVDAVEAQVKRRSEGLDAKKARSLANAIVSQVRGDRLTDNYRKLLRVNSEVAAELRAELSRKDGPEWTRRIGMRGEVEAGRYGQKDQVDFIRATEDLKAGKSALTVELNGEQATITEAIKDESGRITAYTVRTTGGATRRIEAAEAGKTESQAVVADYLTQGTYAEARSAAIRDGQDAEKFARDFDYVAEVLGNSGNYETAEAAWDAVKSDVSLTKEQVQAAWEAGQRKKQSAPAEQVGGEGPRRGRGELRFDSYTHGEETFRAPGTHEIETFKQTARYQVLEALAKAVGVDIVFFQGGDAINGEYRDGTVYISMDASPKAGATVEGYVMLTAAHELTHHIRAEAPELYAELKDFVTKHLIEQGKLEGGKTLKELIEHKAELYARNGDSLSMDAAVEEVVADACEMVLRDNSLVQQLSKENPTLFERIGQWLHDFMARVREAFTGLEAHHTEAKAMEEIFDELQEIWNRGLTRAAQNRAEDPNYNGEVSALESAEKEAAGQAASSAQRNPAPDNHPAASNKGASEKSNSNFSIKESFREDFQDWIDRGKPDRERITVGTTSDALKSIGVDSKRIAWDTSKMNTIQRDHPEMSDAVLVQVPELLERPVIVMESRTQANRLTMFGEVYGDNGLPVMAVIELLPISRGGYEINSIKVVNAYTLLTDSEKASGRASNRSTQKMIKESEILYVDPNKNRTAGWLSRNQLQLPLGITGYGSIKRVSLVHRDVKGKFSSESPTQDMPEWKKKLQLIHESSKKGNSNFSLKDTEAVSDRTLLAAALLSVAQNDAERRRLTQYKAAVLDFQVKQDRINDLLDEMTRARHEGDREKLRKLERERDRKLEQLQRADKKLLELQATKPLKELLSREKQSAAARARASVRESRSRTELRGRIRRLHDELSRRLLKPAKDKYVPRELLTGVARVLELVNTDSGYSQDRGAAVAELNRQYRDIQKDPRFSMAYDEDVAEMISNLQLLMYETGGTSIYDMDHDQLTLIYNTLRAVETTVRNSVKLVNYATEKNAFEIARGMMREIERANPMGSRWLNKWLTASMRPETFFNRLGGYRKGSDWKLMYDMLNEAQRKQLQIQMEGAGMFEELMRERKEMEKLTDIGKTVDIGLKDEDGNTVEVTRDMAMLIYLHTTAEQNAEHLMYSGLTVPDLKRYYKGDMKGAYSKGSVRVTGYGETMREIKEQYDKAESDEMREQLEAQMKQARQESQRWLQMLREKIDGMLTDYERRWIQTAQSFFNDYSKRVLNTTSLAVYGFEKATVDIYVPIHTDSAYRQASFEGITRDMSLENSGFMKERIKGARNPILCEGLLDVVSHQIENVAKYAAMMPALRNFQKVYGKSEGGFKNSVQNAVRTKFDAEGVKYIENLLEDLTAPRHTEGGVLGEFADKLRGNLAASSLTLNPRVALGQAASYPTAAAVVGWKALGKALKEIGNNPMRSEQARQEIAKWSPMMWYRMQGFFDQSVGDIRNSEVGKLMDKAKFLTGWIEAMDGATVGQLWYAAQYYVEDNTRLKRGSDEFMQETAKVFNRIVEETQPNYTTMQRPDILRNPHALVKQMTMFMTQRLQNANILYDAIGEYNAAVKDYRAGNRYGVTESDVQQARIKLNRAITSQLAAAATITAFKLAADILLYNMKGYRDDEEELTEMSISMQLIKNMMESLASNFLWGSEFMTYGQKLITGQTYYGVSLSGIDSFNAFAKSITTLRGEPSLNNLWKLAKSAGQMCGLPLGNAEKFANAVRFRVKDVQDGNDWGSFASEVEMTDEKRGKQLYQALADGNEVKAEKLYSAFGDKATANAQVAGHIKEEFSAGKLGEEEAVKALQRYADVSAYDARLAISKLACERETDGHIKYEDIKQLYIDGKLSEAEATVLRATYGLYEEDEAKATVQQWKCERETGFDYGSLQEYIAAGDLSREKAIELRVKYGGQDEHNAEKTVSKWMCEIETGIPYDKIEDYFAEGQISREELVRCYMDYGLYDEQKAEAVADKREFIGTDDGMGDVSTTAVKNYNEAGAADANIDPRIYYDAWKKINSTYADKDADGNSITGTAIRKKFDYIAGLGLEPFQKTVLAKALGFNEKQIKKYGAW